MSIIAMLVKSLFGITVLSMCFVSCTFQGPKSLTNHHDGTTQNNNQMSAHTIKVNDEVQLSYQLKDDKNTIVDSSNSITLVVGSGSLPFIGLHESLIGMQEGEKQILKLPASKLYGDERQNRIFRKEQLLEISQKRIPIGDLQKYNTEFEGKEFVVINKTKTDIVLRLTNPSPIFPGDTLKIGQESDTAWNGGKMRVEKIEGEYVTVSYPTGHPLSGKSFNVEIEVIKILK